MHLKMIIFHEKDILAYLLTAAPSAPTQGHQIQIAYEGMQGWVSITYSALASKSPRHTFGFLTIIT